MFRSLFVIKYVREFLVQDVLYLHPIRHVLLDPLALLFLSVPFFLLSSFSNKTLSMITRVTSTTQQQPQPKTLTSQRTYSARDNVVGAHGNDHETQLQRKITSARNLSTCPPWPGTKYKCHCWRYGAIPSSSICIWFLTFTCFTTNSWRPQTSAYIRKSV